jgi:hypothetical protein
MEEMINVYSILDGKPEGKRQLGRSGRRCEENIIMELTEIEWEGVDWIHFAQDSDQWRILVNEVMKLRLVISVGFCRWCVSIERIVLLDFSHRLVSQEQTKLRN